MSWNTVLVRQDGEIARVTFNRPTALNAINRQVVEEISEVIQEFEAGAGVRVVIVQPCGFDKRRCAPPRSR